MTRTKEKQTRRPIVTKEDAPKRDAILLAALHLFADRGFHGTTVPDIASRAKVGAGTVYRYFRDKEDIVNVVYRVWKLRLGEYILPAGMTLEGPIRDAFRGLWQRMLEFRNAHPTALAFLELHHHGSYLDATTHQYELGVLMPLLTFCRQGQLEGKLRTCNPEILIAIVYGAFVGLIRAADRGFIKLTPDVVSAAEEAMWNAIRA